MCTITKWKEKVIDYVFLPNRCQHLAQMSKQTKWWFGGLALLWIHEISYMHIPTYAGFVNMVISSITL